MTTMQVGGKTEGAESGDDASAAPGSLTERIGVFAVVGEILTSPGMKAAREEAGREETDAEGSDASTASTSESSSAPTSSVSRGRHTCGSLFAECARHGRSPLLQTFSNPHSFLSRQTFAERRRERESDAFEEAKPAEPAPGDGICVNSNAASDGNGDDAERETLLRGTGNRAPTIEPVPRRLLVRRHNSLPNKTPERETLEKLRELFAASNAAEGCTCIGENASERESGANPARERSKSEGRIMKSLPRSLRTSEADARAAASGSARKRQTRPRPGESRRFLDSSVSAFDGLSRKCEAPRGSGREEEEEEEELSKPKLEVHLKWSEENGVGRVLPCNLYAEPGALRCAIAQLKKENKHWAHKVDFLETEILLLRRELKKRDTENIALQREVSKLRSVLQQASFFRQEDILSSLQDSHGMPGQVQQVIAVPNPNKKQGVSGESSDNGKKLDQIEIQRFDKDFRSKQLIKDAITDNDFLKNLDSSQVREIVESVYSKEFERGSYVIKEGEAGSHLYVSAEGEFEVIKDHKILGRMGPGKAFGELAILYNCRRTASIKVASDAKVWVLDRRVFQQIMMKTGLQRLQENINFLRSVPLLQPLKNDVLAKMADVLEVDFYPSGAHIIRQGASGDTFFIISSGSVKVTQQKPGRQEEEEIRILSKGDYFGEQALLKEDWRTANVIALSPGVECLTLDRDSFIQLIGDLSELQEKNYEDREKKCFSRPASSISLTGKEEYDYIRLEDLEVIGTLGVGGFGRVELVQYTSNKCMTFALKCLKKQHIVDTQQQEHVYSERNIMMACNTPFICRLYKTFRDSKYVYMLLEACLGGEVWTILRERGYFDDYTTRFVTGCVVEAFEYLHARGIIYRDLKPENLLLDNVGYVKIVDFGFSKRLGFSSKTWTFCGTPEYVAPEIILNKGHDRAVDYWSLGILMHELLTGTPPFTAPDPMRTYNIILKGIDMIDFPKHITRAAQSLIKRLCRDSPSERLGYQRGGIQDIKKHKWFQGFDWQGLKQQALGPPITPLVRGPADASNFDYYPKEMDLPPDEFSNWDAEF